MALVEALILSTKTLSGSFAREVKVTWPSLCMETALLSSRVAFYRIIILEDSIYEIC